MVKDSGRRHLTMDDSATRAAGSTCLETFATLRVFSESLHPDEIGRILGIKATAALPRDPASRSRPRRETNYWEWCTRATVDSVDNAAHLESLIELLAPRSEALAKLQALGCETDITNYWVSSGQGGPTVDVEMMEALVGLKLPVRWDVYFANEAEYGP